MVADTHPLGVDGARPSAVNLFLTGKARPWVRRMTARVKTSTTVKSVPGVAAMIAWSVSAGGIAGHWVAGIGPWVSLAVFAWFMTRLDSRIGS